MGGRRRRRTRTDGNGNSQPTPVPNAPRKKYAVRAHPSLRYISLSLSLSLSLSEIYLELGSFLYAEKGASCDVGNGRTTPICRPKTPTVRERGRGTGWGWRLQFRDDGSSEAMVTVSIQHPVPYRSVGQEMLTAELRQAEFRPFWSVRCDGGTPPGGTPPELYQYVSAALL